MLQQTTCGASDKLFSLNSSLTSIASSSMVSFCYRFHSVCSDLRGCSLWSGWNPPYPTFSGFVQLCSSHHVRCEIWYRTEPNTKICNSNRDELKLCAQLSRKLRSTATENMFHPGMLSIKFSTYSIKTFNRMVLTVHSNFHVDYKNIVFKMLNTVKSL